MLWAGKRSLAALSWHSSTWKGSSFSKKSARVQLWGLCCVLFPGVVLPTGKKGKGSNISHQTGATYPQGLKQQSQSCWIPLKLFLLRNGAANTNPDSLGIKAWTRRAHLGAPVFEIFILELFITKTHGLVWSVCWWMLWQHSALLKPLLLGVFD